jgi:hypothetical protein
LRAHGSEITRTESIFLPENPVLVMITAIVIVVVVTNAQRLKANLYPNVVYTLLYETIYIDIRMFFLNIIMYCTRCFLAYHSSSIDRRLIHVATIDLYSVKTRKIAQWPYCKFDLAMQIVTYKHIYTVYPHYTYIVIIYIIESRGKSFIIEGIAVV